ncbi:hypothetical protein N9W17_02420 [Jannaschia sp.]|nr:hypothetical protein [Jannaschia sp.]
MAHLLARAGGVDCDGRRGEGVGGPGANGGVLVLHPIAILIGGAQGAAWIPCLPEIGSAVTLHMMLAEDRIQHGLIFLEAAGVGLLLVLPFLLA